MGKKVIVCDKCKHEFLIDAVSIKEKNVKINNNKITLVYFECPKCNTIYKICLKDFKYNELAEDLSKAKKKIRKLSGKCTISMMNGLILAANTKQNRLANHVKELDKQYPGVFTYSPKNKKEIIYRENYTE